jgi:hypothetical protein
MVEVPLTEAQFAAASQRLAAYGVSLTERSGTLTREGITARYNYANDLLTIEVIKKPALIPVSLIESQLRNYIQKGLTELKS